MNKLKKNRFKKRLVSIDKAGAPRWVDFFEISWSPEKFLVSLAMQVKGEKIWAHTLIVLSPRTARVLQEILTCALTDYEKEHGATGAEEKRGGGRQKVKVDL